MKNETNIPTKIILSGLAGSGKSSVGKELAHRLGYSFRSAGFYAREEARKQGITIQELQVQLEKEPEFDRQLDDQLVAWGKSTDCWVMDYRLGFALLPQASSIYLVVEDAEAARRIGMASRSEEFSGKETIDRMLTSIRERNKNMQSRLRRLYGVDFTDTSEYNHIIPTDGLTVEQVTDTILLKLQETLE